MRWPGSFAAFTLMVACTRAVAPVADVARTADGAPICGPYDAGNRIGPRCSGDDECQRYEQALVPEGIAVAICDQGHCVSAEQCVHRNVGAADFCTCGSHWTSTLGCAPGVCAHALAGDDARCQPACAQP